MSASDIWKYFDKLSTEEAKCKIFSIKLSEVLVRQIIKEAEINKDVAKL